MTTVDPALADVPPFTFTDMEVVARVPAAGLMTPATDKVLAAAVAPALLAIVTATRVPVAVEVAVPPPAAMPPPVVIAGVPLVNVVPVGNVMLTTSPTTATAAAGVKLTNQALVSPALIAAPVVGAKVTADTVVVVSAPASWAVPSRAIEATMAMATNLVTSLMGLRRDILPCPVVE
jgi:hypothetical protein